jgi:hypothetical protein
MAERGAKPDLAVRSNSPADKRSVPHGTEDHSPQSIHLDDDKHQHDDHDHDDDHHRRTLIA